MLIAAFKEAIHDTPSALNAVVFRLAVRPQLRVDKDRTNILGLSLFFSQDWLEVTLEVRGGSVLGFAVLFCSPLN